MSKEAEAIDLHDMDDCPIEVQERAAILEFCGGMTRDEANLRARQMHRLPPKKKNTD